jgi:hypothetical protein
MPAIKVFDIQRYTLLFCIDKCSLPIQSCTDLVYLLRLRRMIGPFIFMDHAGPNVDLPSEPSALDVLPHPHIGLSTVSYLAYTSCHNPCSIVFCTVLQWWQNCNFTNTYSSL